MLLHYFNYAKSSFTWVFSRRFSVSCAPLSMHGGTGAHGTKKLLLKTQVSEGSGLWSESNNKIYYSARSSWTKY